MTGIGEAGGGVPAWAFEPVRLVEHDPDWGTRALVLADEVRDLFGPHLGSDVLHVGSTAVPGLPAKPVIDLQAVSADPARAVAAVGAEAERAKWSLVPRELDRRPWRWLFVRVDREGSTRLAHLHLMPPGQARWDEQLRFRDRLRSSAQLREEYAALKQRLAAEYSGDREAYSEGKGAFVRRVAVDRSRA